MVERMPAGKRLLEFPVRVEPGGLIAQRPRGTSADQLADQLCYFAQMSMVFGLQMLSGCDPLPDPYRDEAIWYDTERIASEAGAALVTISSGEPVGYWTRIVIREEGIDVDSRAWSLTLPETELGREGAVSPFVWSSLVSLESGRLAEGADELMITPLYEALRDVASAHIDAGALHEEALFHGRAMLVAEPNIPWQTIRAVLYSAGQAQFSSVAIVGQVDGRLRYPGAPSAELTCPLEVTARLTPSAAWFEVNHLRAPPLTGPGGCADSDGLVSAVASLSAACVPRWRAALAALGEQPVAGMDCVSVIASPDNELSAAALLQHQARLYEAWPVVDQGLLTGGSMSSGSDAAACQHAVSVASMRPDQLDYICDAERAARSIQEIQHLPSHRARVMFSTNLTGHDLDSLTRAFPDYAAWRSDALPPPSREPSYQSEALDLQNISSTEERP